MRLRLPTPSCIQVFLLLPPQEEVDDPSPSVKRQIGATHITILQEIMQIILRMRMHIPIYHIMHVATYKEINPEIVHLCLE